MLGEDDVLLRVPVPVLFVQGPDAAPPGRALLLPRAAVLPGGIVEENPTNVESHSSQKESWGVGVPPQGEGMLHGLGETLHPAEKVHALLIGSRGKRSQP